MKVHFLDKGSFIPEEIDINDLPQPITVPPSDVDSPGVTSPLFYDATEGINFSAFLELTVDSIVTITNLPPGITYLSNTKHLWGAPTTTGEFQVLIEAENRATGKTSYTMMTIRVAPALTISSEDIFEMPPSQGVKVVPITYYKENPDLLLASRQAMIPSSENAPYLDNVVHYKRSNKYIRPRIS